MSEEEKINQSTNDISLLMKNQSGNGESLTVNEEPQTKNYQPQTDEMEVYKNPNQNGDASKIELTADGEMLNANGEDLSFVTVRISDADGNLVPPC